MDVSSFVFGRGPVDRRGRVLVGAARAACATRGGDYRDGELINQLT
jgi:hypothetical protein